METKPLLYGLIGFMLGGLLVSSVAAYETGGDHDDMSMSSMTNQLRQKTGDEYDKAFIEYMSAHHDSALDMARLSNDRAKHAEIKNLSQNIISSQQREIDTMDAWYKDWGYGEMDPSSHQH